MDILELTRPEAPKVLYTSETARYPGFREMVEPFCRGYGLDIGFGGDPINPVAIRMDLPEPYVYTGDFPVQLGGDCRDLRWFRDEALDYVYSSHVLEDFGEHETEAVIREWTRVLRLGGHLVLLLPDQVRYVQHCRSLGERDNEHHSIAHFSLAYVCEVAGRLGNLEVVMEQPEIGPYSFAVAFRKASAAGGAGERQALHDQLQQVWAERDTLKVRVREQNEALADRQRQLEEAKRWSADVERRLRRFERHPAARVARVARRIARRLLGRQESKTE